MNKRQKKKTFKKKYGVNPPKGLRISMASSAAEMIKNNRGIWENIVNTLIGLGKIMEKVYEKILEDQTQDNIRKLLQCQESENQKES